MEELEARKGGLGGGGSADVGGKEHHRGSDDATDPRAGLIGRCCQEVEGKGGAQRQPDRIDDCREGRVGDCREREDRKR
jgi:hypothetical protein